jgi:hypothetical protein
MNGRGRVVLRMEYFLLSSCYTEGKNSFRKYFLNFLKNFGFIQN